MNNRKLVTMFIAFAVVLSTAFAGTPKTTELTVKGIVKIQRSTELALFVAQEGDWYEIARTKIDSLGNYKFVVDEPKGTIFAVASVPHNLNPRPYKARFFAKNGETIELNAEGMWENYELGTNQSPDNRYFRKWVEMYDEMFPEISNDTYEMILERTDSFLSKAETFVNDIKLKDKRVMNLMRFYIQNDAVKGLFQFYFTPRIKAPLKEQLPPFFEKFAAETTFASPLYREIPITAQMIVNIYFYYNTFRGKNVEASQMEDKVLFSIVNNDPARVMYFIDRIKVRRTYEDFNRLYNKLEKYNFSERQRQMVDNFIKEYKYLAKGQPAQDFKFPDINGNIVALSDFKGKVVVVDMWATWCGPCLGQIPYMQKLEHEFKDNDNVVIISISIDSEADKGKWEAMIKEKNMGGIQLIASQGTEISKYYKINSIPHFMIFDKKGNIASASAPRPSEPKLKQMIEEILDAE